MNYSQNNCKNYLYNCSKANLGSVVKPVNLYVEEEARQIFDEILHIHPMCSFNVTICIIFKVQYPMYIEIRVQWTIHKMGCKFKQCDT